MEPFDPIGTRGRRRAAKRVAGCGRAVADRGPGDVDGGGSELQTCDDNDND
uniref:Uncharacterized protein n=1 Tax=Oryza brachyantha TaxID=4533 RepID=J3LTV3_ORYBR